MDRLAVIQAFGLIAISFVVAVAVLWLLAKLPNSVRATDHQENADYADKIVFLFEDQILINATRAARTFIKAPLKSNDDWDLFHLELRANFPELPDRLSELPTSGDFVHHARDGTIRLRARWHEGITRIELDSPEYGEAAASADRSHVQAHVQAHA